MAQDPKITYKRYLKVRKQFTELMNQKEFGVTKYNYLWVVNKVGHDNDYQPNTVTQIINKTDEELEAILLPKPPSDPNQQKIF